MTERQGVPFYTGMRYYVTEKWGFAIWLPSDWYEFQMDKGHKGVIFSPHKDDTDTCLSVEKFTLKISIKDADIPILRKGFHDGVNALPGVEVEKFDESLSTTINFFEARFTYLDNEVRRKRWIRNVYWGNGQLVMIAQGKDTADFDYYEPMFFNTMYTTDIK
ncbi:MAG: hypothetical protein M1434_05495 [Chloroflexi bacterium]|nr:hypothetical protein [Chloroflexota bacterium]MCL5274189.1 hypothetical protein [Chloroflexota bacterium]